MPQIDMMPEHRASLPKNVHDLSHSFGFTCTCAHLLPVYHDLLDAGEKVRLKFDFNLRTQPLESAAMEDLEVHTEYFFVPMNLLYEPYGSLKYGIQDVYSTAVRDYYSASVNGSFSSLPLFRMHGDGSSSDTNNVWQKIYASRASNLYVYNDCIGVNYIRLMNHLGFNPSLSSQEAGYNPNVFPYQLLAYNCIYQYYYRLDSRERFNPDLFNLDKDSPNSVFVPNTEHLFEMFSIKCRPFDLDYFTNVKVSPIVDVLNNYDLSNLPIVNSWLSRKITGSGDIVLSQGSVGSPSAGPFSDNFNNNIDAITTQFGFQHSESDSPLFNGADIGTANIRAMFANEKLWSITGRAKKRYDDQVLAHLGFKVPHDPKHQISVFGHDISYIHIGEVISTASTEDAPLGEIAGKGYGHSNASSHDFTAPCDGVVMIIFSVVPKMRYDSPFLKINSVAYPQNLPKPEFDHLGMQPLFRYEFGDSRESEFSDIIGWQYRYEEFKRRPNRTTLIFGSRNGASLSSWMVTRLPTSYPTAEDGQPVNISNSYRKYLHSPNELNQIFLTNYFGQWSTAYDSEPSLIYNTDPFVVDSYIHSKKISWLSDYGLPRLDA